MNLGQHIIIELHQCDEDSINSLSFVESSLTEAVNIAKCKILNKYFHKFSPQGITGIIAVCESHFSVHTWPEHKYCAIDIFCCKDNLEGSLEHLIKCFKSKKVQIKRIKRGIVQ